MSEETRSFPLYYWAGQPNFGDMLGPILVEKITGRKTFNIRTPENRTLHGLASIGSLAHSLDRPGLQIWGSGSLFRIRPERAKALRDRAPAAIHAVRGWLTKRELERKLGWSVPAVYGDPAILLPRFYSPEKDDRVGGRISFIPHFGQRSYFEELPEDETVTTINVLDPALKVLDQISSSKCVISSSLHGVICAQAFDIPWVWIRVNDKDLRGGEFKFEDFFTTLRREEVRTATVDLQDISTATLRSIGSMAYLPRAKFNFNALLDAFPMDAF